MNKCVADWPSSISLDSIEHKLMNQAAEYCPLAGQLAVNYIKFSKHVPIFHEFISDDVVFFYVSKIM